MDREGNVERINQSIPQRDSFFNIDLEDVDRWYAALMKFIKIINEESVKFKKNPEHILAFSNIRLIHGRTGYVDSSSNVRHLVGAFLDWDEIYSRLESFEKQVTIENKTFVNIENKVEIVIHFIENKLFFCY